MWKRGMVGRDFKRADGGSGDALAPLEQGDREGSCDQPFYAGLEQNEAKLGDIYANCSDLARRSIRIGGRTLASLFYIDGLTDHTRLEKTVIEPLIALQTDTVSLEELAAEHLTTSSSSIITTFEEGVASISNGHAILLIQGEARGITFGLCSWERRSIEEPTAESVIRGPREGFTESIRINTSQIRRIIKSPRLKMESLMLGEYTHTNLIIAYIEGIADPALIEEVRLRLSRIQIDGILESGYIEEMIEDMPFSPFPQILSTERPDVVCGNLLEGRAAILVEGTPFVLIAPVSFFSLMQSPEDYYQRFWFSTCIRWLRYCFCMISLILPSLYVAITTFHQEMVPGSLLFSMATSREAVPFPALFEALLMEVTFEALREAGVRLPKQIGSAVSIVGALVIGQAAVQAGLVSAPMVIIVAITGISSFMIPRYITGLPIRMLRFPFILLAGSLGLLGVMLGFIALVLHLCSLRSFNLPYLIAIGSPQVSELKDVLIRAPWWKMNRRPRIPRAINLYRQPRHNSDPESK